MRKKDGKTLPVDGLRYFVLAAEHGSLTAAATATGEAQSAFSRQLSGLERALGGRLLHRTGRGVELSELGRNVLPRAQAILADAAALVEDASGIWRRPAGIVNVGLLPSMSKPLTGRLFDRVRQEFPEVRLRMLEAYSGEIEVMLSEGSIDVGTFNRYRPQQRKNQDAVLTSPMCLVAASGTRESGERSVRFSVLAGLPLVMPLRPNSLRTVLDEIASRRRISLDVALEVNSSTAMKDAVMNCKLYAVLPAHAVQDESARGLVQVFPFAHPTIWQSTFVDVTRHRPASSAVREVARLLPLLVKQLSPSE